MSTINNIFNSNATIKGSSSEHYENKFIILKPESLAQDWRDAKWQLYYATGGFGCDPSKMGNAIFGYYCGDGEASRVERYNVLGIASEEAIAEWKQMYGEPIINNEEK